MPKVERIAAAAEMNIKLFNFCNEYQVIKVFVGRISGKAEPLPDPLIS